MGTNTSTQETELFFAEAEGGLSLYDGTMGTKDLRNFYSVDFMLVPPVVRAKVRAFTDACEDERRRLAKEWRQPALKKAVIEALAAAEAERLQDTATAQQKEVS